MVAKNVLKSNKINGSNIESVKKSLIKKKENKEKKIKKLKKIKKKDLQNKEIVENSSVKILKKKSEVDTIDGKKKKKVKKLLKSKNDDLQNKAIVENSSVKSLKKSKLKKLKKRKLNKKTDNNAVVPPALVPTVTKKKSSGLSYNKVNYESSETVRLVTFNFFGNSEQTKNDTNAHGELKSNSVTCPPENVVDSFVRGSEDEKAGEPAFKKLKKKKKSKKNKLEDEVDQVTNGAEKVVKRKKKKDDGIDKTLEEVTKEVVKQKKKKKKVH